MQALAAMFEERKKKSWGQDVLHKLKVIYHQIGFMLALD